MELYGITKDIIFRLSEKDGDYYKLKLGDRLTVRTTHKRNSNEILVNNLAEQKSSDKFMVKYQPSNEIWFDKELIESDKDLKYVSCSVDSESCRVLVGKSNKYDAIGGVIATSGILSLNNLVQCHRKIYYSSNLSPLLVKRKVKVLAVGLKGEKLFGMFYVPQNRGLAVSVDYTESMGFSAESKKYRECWNWEHLCIDDWFDGNSISISNEE